MATVMAQCSLSGDNASPGEEGFPGDSPIFDGVATITPLLGLPASSRNVSKSNRIQEERKLDPEYSRKPGIGIPSIEDSKEKIEFTRRRVVDYLGFQELHDSSRHIPVHESGDRVRNFRDSQGKEEFSHSVPTL